MSLTAGYSCCVSTDGVDFERKAWAGQMVALLFFCLCTAQPKLANQRAAAVPAVCFGMLKKDKHPQLQEDFALIIFALPFIIFSLTSRSVHALCCVYS